MESISKISSAQKDTTSAFSLFSDESSISLLGFSQRSFNALIKSGYDTIDKILALNNESLKAIENLGKKSIEEILTTQKQLRKQKRTSEDERFLSKNTFDCRFVYARETIYSTDYIGILDISFEAHTVLFNSGIFSAGKLFNMNKEAIYSLKKTNKKISEELIAFIAQEKPHIGNIYGDEDLTNYIQKMKQEQQDSRMSILEEVYLNIPHNRLDKLLNLYLQSFSAENIQYSINNLASIFKKIEKISEIKSFFSDIVATSRTNDVVRILELLSFNLIKSLNESFKPFFSDHRYSNSLEILSHRASGFTLQDIAEKRNLTRERIRQIELKSSSILIDTINSYSLNIVSFICAEKSFHEYISASIIREYLEEFEYVSQISYLLENENIYKEYQYNRQYDVFFRPEFELDFSALDIQRPLKELVLNDKEVETKNKIEDFIITKELKKCTYSDICNFTENEVGYARVGKIIQLTSNIVEIEKDWYVHRSNIIDFDDAAEKLLAILKNHFRLFYGYSNSRILFDAACIDMTMFMNDNGFENESVIYMIAKHLFFKEKFDNNKYYFTENLHIWEKQSDFPHNNKGILINLAKETGGIIIRDETEKYLERIKINKNVIINKIHDVSDSSFYFYTETIYVLSDYLQINNAFISTLKKSLDNLFINREYIIPGDINEEWFDTLPKLPLGLSWNLLLLQEIIKYNEEIGYKPLFSDTDQSPYRISGAFVKTNSIATLVDIVYIYTHDNFGLPYKDTSEKYRKLLLKAGFIREMEWFTSMHKVFNDPRYVFTNENKNIYIRKLG